MQGDKAQYLSALLSLGWPCYTSFFTPVSLFLFSCLPELDKVHGPPSRIFDFMVLSTSLNRKWLLALCFYDVGTTGLQIY